METWIKWMNFGRRLGCHQRADRSFYINGYQLPVCARCTGVIIAFFISVIMFIFIKPPVWLCIACAGILFADWFIQRVGIRESTNLRRLITGLLGGYGVTSLELLALWYPVHCIFA